MKIEHLELTLSDGRPLDAVEAIQDEIVQRVTAIMEAIQDPEELLKMRKTLRAEVTGHEQHIKQMKTSTTKQNKKREQALSQWSGFVTGVVELIRKHGIDFKEFPTHLTHGATFAQRLQNVRPDTFVTIEGLRIPNKRTDSLLDDDRVKLFESLVKTEVLEQIIQRKATAMKELFSNDPE